MIELQGTTAAERRQWLSELLKTGTYTVTFTKVDGTSRDMPCTLQENLLPTRAFAESKREPNPETLSVWCVDKEAWRSFRVMNVTAVAEYSPTKETTWIVALEEDPETGDLVMPIPEELLKSQGWKVGDTLDWDFDEKTHTAVLTKKDDQTSSQSGS